VDQEAIEREVTKMTKPRFKVSVSTDEDTGKLLAVYIRIREGQAEETTEVEEDRAYADFDSEGQLLGVELLAPCRVQILDSIAQKESAEVRAFLHSSPPRSMVLA
jgi:uncharacterized protein YuzE